jgi:hypothetical protein
MFKKILISTATILLLITAVFLKSSDSSQAQQWREKLPVLKTFLGENPSEKKVEEKVLDFTGMTELQILNAQITQLGKELKSIDMNYELNSPDVPQARKDEVSEKLNRFTQLVGQYAQIQVAKYKVGKK